MLAPRNARCRSLRHPGPDSARSRPEPLSDPMSPGARLAFCAPLLLAAVLTLDRGRRGSTSTFLRKNSLSENIIPDHVFVFEPKPPLYTHPSQRKHSSSRKVGVPVVPGRAGAAAPPAGRFRPSRTPAHPPSSKSGAETARGASGTGHSRCSSTLIPSEKRHTTTTPYDTLHPTPYALRHPTPYAIILNYLYRLCFTSGTPNHARAGPV